MERATNIVIMSDPHYAGAAERARVDYEMNGLDHPLARVMVRFWRRYLWLRDPFAHNYLVDRFLKRAGEPDLVVANGDFSCDSAFIGLADPASRESALECVGKLRDRFGARLLMTMGDHELGKSSLAGNRGGMRLESWRVTTEELKIAPVWMRAAGQFVLIGVPSTLIALDFFQKEALPEEWAEWQRLRAGATAEMRAVFESVKPLQKIILFCHDPTALPFLAEEPWVRERMAQIERTVIGHLHTPMVFWQARLLAGFPPIHFMGHGVRRISRALHRARSWKPFRVLLCPSLAGSQLLKDGGYYSLSIQGPNAQFTRHRLKWET